MIPETSKAELHPQHPQHPFLSPTYLVSIRPPSKGYRKTHVWTISGSPIFIITNILNGVKLFGNYRGGGI